MTCAAMNGDEAKLWWPIKVSCGILGVECGKMLKNVRTKDLLVKINIYMRKVK